MKEAKKITLKNGLRVVLVPKPQSMAATVLILVQAGSEYEEKRVNGVSHFLEHLMFKGTTKRPQPGAIGRELASLGAQSNAFTDQESTGYWAKVQAEKLPKILEIMADLYLDPLFDAAEIEKERGVIIQEINMYEDDLPARVQREFNSLMYGDQPAGWDVAGDKKTVMGITRDDIVSYRAKRYVAPGTVVVVAGKFNEEKTIREITQYFGHLPLRTAPLKKKTAGRQMKPQVMLSHKESDQGHLVIGFRAFDMFDPRRYAIRTLADILGGGMSSRLFMRIREEMGAAYYIWAGTDLSLDHGHFAISAGVEHAKVDDVVRVILEECATMRDKEVSPEELQRSKDHMIGNIILGLETSDELASFYGGREVLTGSIVSPEEVIQKIKRVNAKEILSVAKEVFKDRNLNFAIVGPYKDEKAFRNRITLP